MRHRTSGRRLGVPVHRRKAMMRQLVGALFLHGRIRTTLARAKETRSLAERIITWGKKGTLSHRRRALAIISRTDVVARIFDHVVEWYRERAGGYTRIIKIGPRMGDAAPMAFLELVDWIAGEKLPGQHTKVIHVAEGEGAGKDVKEKGKDKDKDKGKDKEKEKQEKDKEKKKSPQREKRKAKKVAAEKSEKDPEKAKKIAERNVEKEKSRKERAAARAVAKRARMDKKTQSKSAIGKVRPTGKKGSNQARSKGSQA